jgi:hypothetical protein
MALSSLSATTVSAPVPATSALSSSTLPEPISVPPSGFSRFCVICPATSNPAVSASRPSSSSESAASALSIRSCTTWTRTARSTCRVSWNLMGKS